MHSHNCMHRRHFGAMLAAGAGLSLLPGKAFAAGQAEALALTCIDYRLVDDATRFFDGLHLTNEYDQVSLAGASLGVVSPKFRPADVAFWGQVDLAKNLHHIKKVIVVDHRDCGAYKAVFGSKFASEWTAETGQHKQVMSHFKAMINKKYPDLGLEFYLMALDGKAEKITL